jgi:hypothetical protein
VVQATLAPPWTVTPHSAPSTANSFSTSTLQYSSENLSWLLSSAPKVPDFPPFVMALITEEQSAYDAHFVEVHVD